MTKANSRPPAAEGDDPLDRPVDFSKLKFLGRGVYFKRKAAEHGYVQLEPDVLKDFPTAKEVNEALRLVQQLRRIGKTTKGKRTA